MRAAFSFSRHLRSFSRLSPHLSLSPLHTTPSPSPPTSQILNTSTILTAQNPNPTDPPSKTLIQDEPMTEFLSRLVHSLRPKLAEAFPGLARNMLDQMLVVICQKVVGKMEGNEGLSEGLDVELSEDLWKAVWEVSKTVHEAMKRDRIRAELKKYVHCDEVKQMCRFAADIGIRGSLLRELRFKWAREKLEEDEFYLNLEKIREQGTNQDSESGAKEPLKLTSLPQRKGKIAYKIYGLDLSDPKWAEIAERVKMSEREFVKEEMKPIEGKCRRIEERLTGLDSKNEGLDLERLVREWKEGMEGVKRVDWVGFLERVKERNLEAYLKVAEFLLTEETFEPTIRDYSRLIDLHSKSNRFQDAERILNKMTDAGFQPDTLTSITLVHMYGQIGNLDLAKQHFVTLKESGFKLDFKLYNSMINACIKARQPMLGVELAKEMERKDIKPGRENYMGLLRTYGELRQVENVQSVMDTMQFYGVNPDLEAYNIVIQAYSESSIADHVDNARGQFDQMIRMGIKPDDSCTSAMIKTYMNRNMLDKALDLLLTLEKEGFKLGVKTYSVLLEWFGRLGLVEEAEQVAGRIRDETGSDPLNVHVGLCNLYARVRLRDKLKDSIRVLDGKKKELSAEQFERVLSGLLDGGFIEEVKRVCNWMQANGFELPESVRVSMTLMKSQSGPHSRPNLPGRKGFR